MDILEITSREFRERQKEVFDRVDNGEQVLISRRRKLYRLVPVDKADLLKEVKPNPKKV